MTIREFNSVHGFSVSENGNLVIDSNRNITANDLTVVGTSNLGPVGNLIITGGNSGYFLSTDGTGNLSWVPASGNSGIAVDTFTGDGETTEFTLSVTPLNEDYTIVSLAATFQPRSTYSVSGNVLTFSSPPANTAPIEVTIFTLDSGAGGGGSANIAILDEGNVLTNTVSSINFTGNGVTATASGNSVTVDISSGGGGGASAGQAILMSLIFR